MLSNCHNIAIYERIIGKNSIKIPSFFILNIGGNAVDKKEYVLLKNYHIMQREVEREIKRAIEEGELVLYFQPKVNPLQEKIEGAEVLVRWFRKEGKIVRPNEFIPILEEYDAISFLDAYIFKQVCKIQREWLNKGYQIPMSVNESRRHLKNEHHIDELMEVINTYQIPTCLIELEMTESAVVENIEEAKRAEKTVHQYGFVVSMDDFGTGYSSFSMLKDIIIDVLKIDKSFFDQILENERGKIIVEAIFSMAKKLGIKTVAEGIETKEQVQYLCSIGCDLIQGYYYDKPLSKEEFERKWLAGCK